MLFRSVRTTQEKNKSVPLFLFILIVGTTACEVPTASRETPKANPTVSILDNTNNITTINRDALYNLVLSKRPSLESIGFVPVENGINTGAVIICGTLLPRPYQVVFNKDDESIRINGVLIWPYSETASMCDRSLFAGKHEEISKEVEILEEKRNTVKILVNTNPILKAECKKRQTIVLDGKRKFIESLSSLNPKINDLRFSISDASTLKSAAKETTNYLNSKYSKDISILRISEEYIEIEFRKPDGITDEHNRLISSDLYCSHHTIVAMLNYRISASQKYRNDIQIGSRTRHPSVAAMQYRSMLQCLGANGLVLAANMHPSIYDVNIGSLIENLRNIPSAESKYNYIGNLLGYSDNHRERELVERLVLAGISDTMPIRGNGNAQ